MKGSPGSVSENDGTSDDGKLRRRHCNIKSTESPSDRLCKVCGDQAIGYNFSVITCESCKAFFRRNANREKSLPKCPFESKCQITVNTRRFCQMCRLKKCLQVGMKREWIMNEGYRRTKRPRLTSIPEKTEDLNKILNELEDSDVTLPKAVFEQLVRKSTMDNKPKYCQCKCTCGFYPPDTPLTAANTADQDATVLQSSQPSTSAGPSADIAAQSRPTQVYCQKFVAPETTNLTSQPLSGRSLNLPSFQTPPNFFSGTSSDAGTINPSLVSFPSSFEKTLLLDAMNATIQSEYSVQSTSSGTAIPSMMPDRPYPQPTYVQSQELFGTANEYSRFLNGSSQAPEAHSSILVLPEGLSHHERFLLQELIIANAILKQPLDAKLNLQRAEDIALMDVVRITDLALRRIIKMAKEISYFRELSQEDQIALLKGSASELLILRGVMVFNPSQDVWDQIITKGQNGMKIKLDVLKSAKQHQHYEEHKRFLTTFGERWRQNENVMLLLSAIVLFRPDRPNIRDYDTVLSNQQEYYSLFKRYLRLQCSSDVEAQQAYDLLLRKLIDLHQLSQSMMEIIYGLNVNEMDPLLLELFDLTKKRNSGSEKTL